MALRLQSEGIIVDNIKKIKEKVEDAALKAKRDPSKICLMAVTKNVPPELVNVAIREGITLLGENRVQEYLQKREFYEKAAEVHFIGQLQSNKISSILPHITMIQSVHSQSLAEKLDTCLKKQEKTLEILLEVNIGKESTKSGFLPDNLTDDLQKMSSCTNILIKGLMCIPPRENTQAFFLKMHDLVVDIHAKNIDNINMTTLSMGMSMDFEDAVLCGSTLIRLGRAIFWDEL